MSKFKVVCVCIAALPSLVWAWGGTGHKLINKNAVMHLPASMKLMIDQQAYLEAHASDPDFMAGKVSTDHFIDIDSYQNFQNKTLSYDSLVSLYGSYSVSNIGTVPWVAVRTLDSLTAQFRRGDWTKAYLTASYLGHWIGDSHQPLHLTKNYNGDLTNNSGIHSRYESNMLNSYQSSIAIARDSVRYINRPLDYVFSSIDAAYPYVDSIMIADTQSKKAPGGSTYSAAYYDSLWAKTGAYTKRFIQQATVDLACFWYTAWVNAGFLANTTDVAGAEPVAPARYSLSPNYPNPFNPTTNIRFSIGSAQFVTLDVYDVLGCHRASLVRQYLAAGSYTIQWNAAGLPSGIYYSRLQAGVHAAVQKMIYQK